MTIYACSKRVTVHVGQHNLRPRHSYNLYSCTAECCGCCSGPRHLLRSIVGYGNVAVNRQQHSYNYLGGGKDWSVSGIADLLHSSASPSAHRNQPMSSQILINVCTTSALVKYQEILVNVYAHSVLMSHSWDRTQVSGNRLSIKKAYLHYVNIH